MRVGELVGGRYRLTAHLGQGAMARVFRATDEVLRRQVAVKVVDLTTTTDRTIAERFRREAVATAQLNHHNIVTIYDSGSDGRTAWLVMELLAGSPLSTILHDRGTLPQPRAVEIGQKVAAALVATHAIGVVHRDIKPANIMVSGPQVTLLDFGIAQVSLDADSQLTAPATTLGTAAYMSPEQAQGLRATASSDVYALGGVLVAMLTGQPPYPGENPIRVANRHLTEPPVSVRSRRPDVSVTLDDLVLRMMAKDPGARPTAAIVAQALGHLTANTGAAQTAAMPTAAAGAVPPPPAMGTRVMPAATTAMPGAGGPAGPGPAGQQDGRRTGPGSPLPSAHRVSTTSDAPGTGRAVDDQPFRTAATWIAVLVAAILVFMVSWAIGVAVFRVVPAVPATPEGTPTPAPSARDTPSGPSVSLPSLPSAEDAALRAALTGVDAALGLLPTDTAQGERTASALKQAWAATSADVLAGERSQRAIDRFRARVEAHRDEGNLRGWQAEVITFALSGVEAALPGR